jgi:2-polyprenyl-6-hydroxyphenyl methylase/3-demethylubiquinone-9 3-methyltransferase
MSTDKEKYYQPLKLMLPIRYQYMKKIMLSKNKDSFEVNFKNKKILDIGTGTGEFIEIFADIGADCSGVDTIDNFKVKKHKKLKLVKADLYQYLETIPKNYFDYIFCFEVMEHLDDKKKLFKLIKKTLKNKGILFMSTINKNIISKIFAIGLAENIFKLLPKNTHEYDLLMPIEELEKLCEDNNFNIIDVTGLKYNPLFKNFNFSNIQLINYISAIEN